MGEGVSERDVQSAHRCLPAGEGGNTYRAQSPSHLTFGRVVWLSVQACIVSAYDDFSIIVNANPSEAIITKSDSTLRYTHPSCRPQGA